MPATKTMNPPAGPYPLAAPRKLENPEGKRRPLEGKMFPRGPGK